MQDEKVTRSAHGRIHKETPIGHEPSSGYTLHAVPRHDHLHDRIANQANDLKSAPKEKGHTVVADLTEAPTSPRKIVGVVEKDWEERIEGHDKK